MSLWCTGGYGTMGMIFFAGLGFFLILILLAGGYALLRPSITPSANSGSPSRSARALDVLKERYARGEVTREEYEQMRRDLVA